MDPLHKDKHTLGPGVREVSRDAGKGGAAAVPAAAQTNEVNEKMSTNMYELQKHLLTLPWPSDLIKQLEAQLAKFVHGYGP